MMRFTFAFRRRMLSSVTNDPFPPAAQIVLNQSASANGFVSPYWFTLAQCQRSLGGTLKPGATPTPVTLAVEAVFPFEVLPKETQTFVLDQHPAYFASGVGILSHRYKWNAVLAKRLVQQLNPNGDARAFFVDVAFAQGTLKYRPKPSDVVDITAQSTVLVYNGDQLIDPYKAAPAEGIALNAMTGKRLAQPAHDILLAVGTMRGYVSPYWVAEAQIPKLNVALLQPPLTKAASGGERQRPRPPAAGGRDGGSEGAASNPSSDGGVDVATLNGTVVRLADIKQGPLREALLRELLSSPHLAHHVAPTTPDGMASTASPNSSDARATAVAVGAKGGSDDAMRVDAALRREGGWMWLLYGANGWEALRSEAVVRAMYHLIRHLPPTVGTLERCTFVNVDDTIVRRPDLAEHLREELHLQEQHRVELDGASNGDQREAAALAVPSPQSPPSFRLEDVTRRRYYNAAAFTTPHLVCPVVRPIAIVNGKLAGRRAEGFLRHASLQQRFSSPVWLTQRGARLLGVDIVDGATGLLPPNDAMAASATAKQFYNLDDIVNKHAVLQLHPLAQRHLATAKGKHYVLEGKWRPVLGTKRKAYFDSLKCSSSLWVSSGEIVMSGLTVKPNAVAHSMQNGRHREEAQTTGVNGGGRHRRKRSDRAAGIDAAQERIATAAARRSMLYNSEQTSDPVRVIGRSQYFARPQVLKGSS